MAYFPLVHVYGLVVDDGWSEREVELTVVASSDANIPYRVEAWVVESVENGQTDELGRLLAAGANHVFHKVQMEAGYEEIDRDGAECVEAVHMKVDHETGYRADDSLWGLNNEAEEGKAVDVADGLVDDILGDDNGAVEGLAAVADMVMLYADCCVDNGDQCVIQEKMLQKQDKG